jgi:hypothetical protein
MQGQLRRRAVDAVTFRGTIRDAKIAAMSSLRRCWSRVDKSHASLSAKKKGPRDEVRVLCITALHGCPFFVQLLDHGVPESLIRGGIEKLKDSIVRRAADQT